MRGGKEVKVCGLRDITALTNPSIRAGCGQIRDTVLFKSVYSETRRPVLRVSCQTQCPFLICLGGCHRQGLGQGRLRWDSQRRTGDTKTQLGEHSTLLAKASFLTSRFCSLCPICFLGSWESPRASYVVSSSGTWAQVARTQLWAPSSFPSGDNTVSCWHNLPRKKGIAG